MASALQKAGYHVVAVSDGAEGFSLALHEQPDCLIVDIVLPGMGGFEICRRLRSRAESRNLPIIMVSTKNTPVDQAWGLRQGANRYLPKPFSEGDLVKAVNDLLSAYPHPSATTSQSMGSGPHPTVQNISSGPRPVVQKASTGPQPAVHPMGNGSRPSTPNMGSGPRPAVQNMGSGPHPPVQNAGGTAPRISSIRPTWFKLIPARREDDDMLWASDPQSIVVRDMQVRYFYAAIDGQRNLEQLGMIMRMNADDILRVVRLLLVQQHILLYEPDGHPADHTILFPELS